MSIYYEQEGIKITDSYEQLQEETEDLEEQERRNQEIQNELYHAFDDLESSTNSSTYLEDPSNLSSKQYQNEGDSSFFHANDGIRKPERRKSNNSISKGSTSLSTNFNVDVTVDHQPQYGFDKDSFNPNNSCNFVTPINRYSHDNISDSEHYYTQRYKPLEAAGPVIDESRNVENPYQDKDFLHNISSEDVRKYHPDKQLEVLNTVRIREIEKLTFDLRQLQREKDEAVELLERKCTLSEIEINKLNVLKHETEIGLNNANSKISELEQQILILKQSNENLEKSKQEVIEKLSSAEDTINVLEEKIHVLEDLDYGESSRKSSEKYLQQMQENYSIQLRNMQTQVDVLSRELENKKTAYDLLEKQYTELSKIHNASSNNYCELSIIDKQTQTEYDRTQYQLNIVLKKYDELTKIYNNVRQKVFSSDLERKDSESLQSPKLQREKELYDLKCTLQFLQKENACYSDRIKLLEQDNSTKIMNHSSDAYKKITENLGKFKNIIEECNKIKQKYVQVSQDIRTNVNEEFLDTSVGMIASQENTKTTISNKLESDYLKEIVRLKTELHEVQKELDRVKELYIDVCATKDRITSDYKNQLNNLQIKQQQNELQLEQDTISENIQTHISKNKQLFNECISQLKSVTNIEEDVQTIKNVADQCTQTNLEIQDENETDQADAPPSISQQETENLISENTLKEMKEQMESKVAEKLRYVKEQYEQKYKTDQENFTKILLLLKREIEEKNLHIKKCQEAYLTEKSKIYSDMKEKEEKLMQLVEAKIISCQNQIFMKNQLIENLNNKVLQIQMNLEEDKNAMANIMSEWISEIQQTQQKNTDLENKLKESEEKNVNFCTEIQNLKTKAINDFQQYKKKYETIKNAASKYKEYANKKEEYIILQCKQVESGYKKAIRIIEEKIEVLLVLHEKRSYLLNKRSSKSAR